MTDTPETPADDPVDPQLDTTDGTRDPLSTDDGLVAASALIPAVPDGTADAGEPGDADPEAVVETQADPSLDVSEDGVDPLADATEED